jgi:predicted nucleotidyltransferase
MYKRFCREKHSEDHKGQDMAARKNKDIIIEELKQYISLLRTQNISVIHAYLFGSYAKNRVDEWSDIDVAVVTDRFVGDRFDFRFLLTRLARKIDMDIEPHPYLLTEFNNGNPLAAEILKTGELIV